MTYKLVDILTSLKVLKIKNILLYEMEFLERIYSCLPAEPLNRGLPPPGPRSLCPLSSTEFAEHPKQNSWARHWRKLLYKNIIKIFS